MIFSSCVKEQRTNTSDKLNQSVFEDLPIIPPNYQNEIPEMTFEEGNRALQLLNNRFSRNSVTCDFDLGSNSSLDCNVHYFNNQEFEGIACLLYLSYTLVECRDITGSMFFQIKDLTWYPSPNCTHQGILNAYNDPTDSRGRNLIEGFILNFIEEKVISPMILPTGSDTYHQVHTLVPRYCRNYCPELNEFVVCSKGCCYRESVLHDIDGDGDIDDEFTLINSNYPEVGQCVEDVPFDCPSIPQDQCDNPIDCGDEYSLGRT